jgi:hypothetical protein
MTVDQLSNAISNAFSSGFRDFIVGSLVALLPMLWIATLAFYLMRPYAIRTLRKLSLRFAADVFWLTYVLLRDTLLIATFVVSLMFFYPNLLHDDALPISATLSAVFLLWVLLVKMVRDPDENPADYRLSVLLLTIGSALYLVPLTLGIEVTSQRHLSSLVSFFTSSSNFDLAIALFYVSVALIAVTSAYIFGYVVMQAAPKGSAQASPPARPVAPAAGTSGD